MVNTPSMHCSARSVYMAAESGQAEAAAALCSRLIRPTNEGDRMSHVASDGGHKREGPRPPRPDHI